jgi:dTDP-6-deoxy-L-talose 4-dehydrogenase (NAD+)
MILITGADGYFGQKIINYLKDNNNIIGIIRSDNKNKKLCKNKKIKYLIVKNIFNKKIKWWKNKLNNVEYVFHLAWYTKHKDYLSNKKNKICYSGSLPLIKASKIMNVKKFLGFGTCLEYQFSDFYKSSKINPKSIYAKEKFKLYKFCKKHFYRSATKFLWYRIFYVFGKNEQKEKFHSYVLSNLKASKKIYLKSPKKIVDFVHIDVAVKQIINTFKIHQNVINIMSGRPKSLNNIVNEMRKKYKKNVKLKI